MEEIKIKKPPNYETHKVPGWNSTFLDQFRCAQTPGEVAVPFVFTVAPNMCGYSAWNMLRVTILAPRILRWLLDFLKIYAPL